MRYWDDMSDKYGFSDGEATPPDALVCRAVYVLALNAAARCKKSSVRAICYNRPGFHNSVLIFTVEATDIKKWTEDQILGISQPALPENHKASDDAWETTVEECKGMDLDNFVEVKVSIHSGFKGVLKKLKSGKPIHS